MGIIVFANEFAAKGLVSSQSVELTTLMSPNDLLEEGNIRIHNLVTRLRVNGHTLRTMPENENDEQTSIGLFAVRSISTHRSITSTTSSSPERRDGAGATKISIYANGIFSYTPDESIDLENVDKRLLDGRTIALPNAVLKLEDFIHDTVVSRATIRASQFSPKY